MKKIGETVKILFSVRQWQLRHTIFVTTLVVSCYYFVTNSTPPEKQVQGWEPHVTRDVATYIHPGVDTTIISGEGICEFNTFLVIIVASFLSNFEARSAIRQTWGLRNSSYVKVGFIVGLAQNSTIQAAIEEESAKFKDMIQENFVETYNNLTLKSIFLLKWFIQHCHSDSNGKRIPQFLMKADDDTFVQVSILVKQLALFSRPDILVGSLSQGGMRITNDHSKHYAPKYMYKGDYYPDYLDGPGYIMGRDAVQKLYDTALRTPIFHLEDVYITGICAQKAGIHRLDFGYFKNHSVSPKELYAIKPLSAHYIN